MARLNTLTAQGRTDLDTPPDPTTPPEAAPRLAQLSPATEEQSEALTLGTIQQQGVILQTGMAAEKAVLALASLVPGFDEVAQQIIPLLRKGIQGGVSQSRDPNDSGITPVQQSPLQQG